MGAASGDVGIWHRLLPGFGVIPRGNVGLAAMAREKGADYARNNLSFAPREFWSTRTEDQHVLDREGYWKRLLMSREQGLILN